jgi:peptidoglycan hydrolase-like protein with peptidoglycan-binding domain
VSAEAERETVAAEFDQELDLEQLRASVAASDARIAKIREAISALGYGSVAQALKNTPAPDDTIASHNSPTANAPGALPWVSIAAVATASILFVLLGSSKPPASSNRDVRSIGVETVTTAIKPRDDEQSTADGSDTGSGLRQAEESTVAPQEAAPEMAIRSTLPPSEDDSVPAPLAALSSPPIAAPVPLTTAFPTPLLDLGQIEDAKRIQRRLTSLGFLFGTANGNWGPQSRKALRDFRVAQGLGPGDSWDRQSQQALFSAAAVRVPATGTFVGGWGINVDQCRQAPDNRSPLRIDARHAEAFSTTCQFNSTQRESANEWRIRASCADEHGQWSANIRLTLAGSRLTWTSERGTATYLRCPAISN